jgi:hypothetical protein
MNSAVFYNSTSVFCNAADSEQRKQVPGAELFSCLFNVFGDGISIIDRSKIITNPINCHVLPFLEIPQITEAKDFNDICDERARELLNTNRNIAVMYSGGIDSTLILSAFLKNTTKDKLNKITVLLSEHSIEENPNFYRSHVLPNFKCVSSYNFSRYLGNDQYLLISGEHGDQLYGSAVTAHFVNLYGYNALYSAYNDAVLIDFIRSRLPFQKKKYAERLYCELKKVVDAAPVQIETVYEFFWWLNFATKWQDVYVRILPYAQDLSKVKLQENYTTFFSTDEFQIWSMSSYKKHGTEKGVAKYDSKKYIIDVSKDQDFMNKPKKGSLCNLMIKKRHQYLLDKSLNSVYNYPDSSFINYNNNFA